MTDWGSIVLFIVKNGCLYVISLRFLIKIHKFVDNSSIWQHVGYMRNKSINKRENVMNRLLTTSFVLAVAAGMAYTAFATDDNKVLVGKIQTANPAKDSKALRLEYRPAPFPSSMPRTIRRADAKGVKADFSVKNAATGQETVWAENFDNGTLADWTQDNGEGNNVTFTLKQPSGDKAFTGIDPDDKASLHIDGPYNIVRRTIGTITSKDIDVPANAQFHGYVYFDTMWNEYATLTISASADGFATQTDLWKSTSVADKGSAWRKVDADLTEFAGKTVKLRLTYGPGTDDGFNVGGYLGDFYVDGLTVSSMTTIDQIAVKTGEEIQFADLTAGTPESWEWTFPGGTPETSTDQNPTVYYTKPGNYDVTLKVKAGDEEDEVTKTAFVSVEGQEPTAQVGWPAEFRDLTTRMRMMAPLATVHYTDRSTGFPDQYSWAIYSEYELKNNTDPIFTPKGIFTTKDVDFSHEKMNKWYVTHIAQNETGYTFQDDSVQVQFDGYITNFEPKDGYQTNFTDGNLTLPGANKLGITAWAEKFSKPSTPMLLTGMYVNFTKASAEELTDQIANVSFSLYTSKDGLPDQKIDLLDTWTMTELNYALTTKDGVVEVQLSKDYVINDEFFVVIDGIPEKNDAMECAFAMAPMRDHGNTAYMLKNGEWRPLTGYFQAAPGGQTSLAVFPVVKHSVMVSAKVSDKGEVTVDNDTVFVDKEAGVATKTIFSKLGWKTATSDEQWCKVVSEPGEYTADDLQIEYSALPVGIDKRDATITITDGVGEMKIVLVQENKVVSAINDVSAGAALQGKEVYDLNGMRIDSSVLPKGIYIVRDGKTMRKVVR